MANAGNITVRVSLDIDVNGEPVTHLMEMPASVEDMGERKGLTVHLHLDAHKLTHLLAPHIAHELPSVIRTATGARNI